VLFSQANGFSSITSLGHYQEVLFALQELASALSHQVVIVSHEDCDLIHESLFSSLPYLLWHSSTEGFKWEIYDNDSAIYHALKMIISLSKRAVNLGMIANCVYLPGSLARCAMCLYTNLQSLGNLA
jgi:hypothetical protein